MRPRVEDGRQDGEPRLGDAYLAKAPGGLPRCDRMLRFDGSSLGYAWKSSPSVSVLLANGAEGDVVDHADRRLVSRHQAARKFRASQGDSEPPGLIG
jgi:hypothetical protein